MSGGVDSSVTAYLLKRAGWDVLGVTMKIPVFCDAGARGCCGADAAFVCGELGLPHFFVDVTEAFDRLIIRPFRKSYSLGQTPNPCVDCNSLLKFSLLWDFLEETFEITCLATGHYARVVHEDDSVRLCRAANRQKDQSYFLYGIPARRLADLILPLGNMSKQSVRAIASELNLSVADKAESMELCFAGERDYRVALGRDDMHRRGNITDMHGAILGTHEGIANYTLGQRRGLGFAGGRPLYVGKIDAQNNTIALGTRDEVSGRVLEASIANVLLRHKLVVGDKLLGKIRSHGDPRPCRIMDIEGGRLMVEFDEAQFAPCPGQKLVLYDNQESIVAGGTILPS
jgi:tRNA-specific 2-thiouridylase